MLHNSEILINGYESLQIILCRTAIIEFVNTKFSLHSSTEVTIIDRLCFTQGVLFIKLEVIGYNCYILSFLYFFYILYHVDLSVFWCEWCIFFYLSFLYKSRCDKFMFSYTACELYLWLWFWSKMIKKLLNYIWILFHFDSKLIPLYTAKNVCCSFYLSSMFLTN